MGVGGFCEREDVTDGATPRLSRMCGRRYEWEGMPGLQIGDCGWRVARGLYRP